MKILNKKNLLLSSAVVAGMLFTVSTKTVYADSTNGNQGSTNTLQVNKEVSVPDKSLIMPVASRDHQTLRQVAQANNTSLSVLEN
nr:hypothetical protein [Lactobacillus helveticus]